jgi:hypothetical protein
VRYALKKIAVVAAAAAAITVTACVDMSAPKGAAAISVLQLPALYIVRGDSMRDTNGVASVPAVIAYDAAGSPIADAQAQFFITDSVTDAIAAKFGDNGVLLGTKIGIVHVIGQIGNLQTPVIAIPVTAAPTKITKPVADTALNVPVGPDSASSIGAYDLGVLVQGGVGADTTIQGVVVTYTLTPLATVKSFPSTYLADDNGGMSRVDTTSVSGQASRRLVVNALALGPAFIAGAAKDTVLITASAKYKGAPIPGSPITFKIPLKSLLFP